MFLLAFTSVDIIFHKFLEIHSTGIKLKKRLSNFPFFNGFNQIPQPLNEWLKSAKCGFRTSFNNYL